MKFEDIHPVILEPDHEQYTNNKWAKIYIKDGKIWSDINGDKINRFYWYVVNTTNKNDGIFTQYTLNEVFNQGIKIVKPSFEQCLTLKNIEVNINLEEYEQPFKSLAIEFPQEYTNYIERNYKIAGPRYSFCHLDVAPSDINEKEKYYLSYNVFNKNLTFSSSITRNQNLETYLQTIKCKNIELEKSVSIEIIKEIERITFNLNMLLCHFGMQHIGYENMKRHRYFERNDIEKAKRDPYYIALKQDIKLYDKEIIKYDGKGKEGKSPRPHWRRGHWRMQPYGTGRELRKKVFIKAIFVCAEDYKGDMTETNVNYRCI